MRVLTFLHSLEVAGVERDALRLIAAWSKLGVDARLALGRRDGALAAELPDVPTTCFETGVFQTGRLSTARLETLWMIARLPREILRQRPDVLFCAGNTYTIVAVAMRLLLGRRCPPIVLKVSNDLERRDLPAPARWGYHAWLRMQARAFVAAVAMAEPARAEIERYLPGVPVTVIENASLTEATATGYAHARDAAARVAVRRPEGRRFLAVGRLVAQKNFSLLIEAFASIAGPDDTLTIVGEGPQRERLAAKVLASGVGSRVALPGHVQPLDAYYAAADAFVLSSDYEGLGVVVVEALAAGVPVVATDCSVNMAQLVGDAGLVVPIRDGGALAAAMAAAVVLRPDVAAMRARAASFTVERAAPRWLALFGRVVR